MSMDEDFLNELFGDDFGKKNLNKMKLNGFLGENGEINYDKLGKEYIEMFEKLSGKKIDDILNMGSKLTNNLLTSMDNDKVGIGFVQDLESKEGIEMFDSLIKQHNLTKESSIIEIDGDDCVEEIWTNVDESVRVKRIYKLDNKTTPKMINKTEQISLYEKKLNDLIDVENYEEAAIIRDKINILKKV